MSDPFSPSWSCLGISLKGVLTSSLSLSPLTPPALSGLLLEIYIKATHEHLSDKTRKSLYFDFALTASTLSPLMEYVRSVEVFDTTSPDPSPSPLLVSLVAEVKRSRAWLLENDLLGCDSVSYGRITNLEELAEFMELHRARAKGEFAESRR